MKSGRSNEQILESYVDALCSLFSINAAGKLGDRQRDGMHDQIPKDAFSEKASSFTSFIGIGSVNPVGKLNDTHRR